MTRPFPFAIGLFTSAALLAGAAGPAGAQTSPQTASGPATFRVFFGGRPVATESVNVTISDTEWVLTTGTGAQQQKAQSTFSLRQAEFHYDRQWHPRSAKIEATVKDEATMVTTTFADGKADSNIIQGNAATTKSVAISPTAVILPNNVFGAYEALAARLVTAEPGSQFALFVMPNAEVKMTLDSVTTERVKTTERAFASRHHYITVHNSGADLKAELWTDDRGRLTRFVLPAASIDVAREDMAAVSTRQTTTFRENDEDVFIPANGFNLAGTVAKPKIAAAALDGKPTAGSKPAENKGKPVKLPAIVLIGGSGPTDRDETIFGIPVFAQLGGALADAGYLVLRYDKRGAGQSGGRTESATLLDYTDDALAAVRYLREKRKDVDEDRIVVMGHSEGAAVAMLAARRDSKIKALVLVACPGSTGAELVINQQRHTLERMKTPDEEREQKIALQMKIQAAVISGQGWDDIPAPMRQQADTPWFRSFLQFDPAAVMKDVKQPVLIVQGELDRMVPASHADKLAAMAKARKKPADVQIALLPGINHLLVPAKTGEMDEYSSLETKTITPEVASKTADWLKTALAPPKS